MKQDSHDGSKTRSPLSMTLRQAYTAYYDTSALARGTLQQIDFNLRRWERHTLNPPIGRITDEDLEAFRDGAIKDGWATSTMSICEKVLRAIVRRVGLGNPWETSESRGLPLEVAHSRPAVPRGLALESDISCFYRTCETMQSPRLGFPPAWWWQGLLVWYYCTGMRMQDALRIRFSDIDWERWTVRFVARRSRKPSELPLHSVLLAHVNRIRTEREFIFRLSAHASWHFDKSWRCICRRARLKRVFTCGSLRQTGAREIDRAAASRGLPQMAPLFLKGFSPSVPNTLDSWQLDELREAIEALRLPRAFKEGLKQAESHFNRSREQAIERMESAYRVLGAFPSQSEWCFTKSAFAIRGTWIKTAQGSLRIMRALAMSPKKRCTLNDLAAAMWPSGFRPKRFETMRSAICDRIGTLRARLRWALFLPDAYDPIPCIERGHGGAWTIYLPAMAQGGAA